MSVLSKAMIAAGFAEGILGHAAALLTGDAGAGIAGTTLGALTIMGGVFLDAQEGQALAPAPARSRKGPEPR